MRLRNILMKIRDFDNFVLEILLEIFPATNRIHVRRVSVYIHFLLRKWISYDAGQKDATTKINNISVDRCEESTLRANSKPCACAFCEWNLYVCWSCEDCAAACEH